MLLGGRYAGLMDKETAIAMLLSRGRGVESWNHSRKSAFDARSRSCFDLRGAGLSGANLDSVDLRDTDLRESDLSGASLVSACLRNADLTGADLNHADLTKGDLNGARASAVNFSGAVLRYADLTDTYLVGSNLRGARLGGANLRRTRFNDADLSFAEFGTTVIRADLSVARGLETATHYTHSEIFLGALCDSSAPWPIKFLRGCGLSDFEIETVTAMANTPIQYYSAFISYSTKDDVFAVKLHDALQARGVRCWLDKHTVLPGDSISHAVNDGIRLWDKVVLCCSKDSLTSWWVNDEVTRALEKERKLQKERGRETLTVIPLDLDGHLFANDEFEYGATLRKRHAARFGGWQADEKLFDVQLERVIAALRADEHARPKPPAPKL